MMLNLLNGLKEGGVKVHKAERSRFIVSYRAPNRV